jgi:hybrid cluster-associated redox disulfide protein
MTQASNQIDDPDLPLDEVITRWPETVKVFLDYQVLCVGCLVAPFHTVSDACMEHGLDEASFRADLRQAVEGS